MQKEDKYLDILANKIIKDNKLDSPSIDFVNNVMEKLEGLSANTQIRYQPIISSKKWLIIGIVLAGIIMLANYTDTNAETSNWMSALTEKLSFSDIPIFKVKESIFSQTLIYASLITGIMFFFQIYILKKGYYDK